AARSVVKSRALAVKTTSRTGRSGPETSPQDTVTAAATYPVLPRTARRLPKPPRLHTIARDRSCILPSQTEGLRHGICESRLGGRGAAGKGQAGTGGHAQAGPLQRRRDLLRPRRYLHAPRRSAVGG